MDAPAPIDPAPLDLDSAGVAPPAFTHAQILRAITGVLLCIFLSAMDQTVVVPAVPAIAADLNGFDQLSWIVASYLITSTAATPIYGKLSDIYGRRAMLLPAIVLFGIASALCALAQNLPQLIAARALQGLGGAGLMAMAQAVIADVVAPRERGRYQGYMAGTWASASIAGPIVGGWLTQSISWHWIFWINLPFCAAAFLLSSRALRILRTVRRPARIDYLGAALLTVCVTALLTLLSRAGEGEAARALVIPGAVAAAALAVLAVQQKLAPDALLPPRLFANRVIACGIGIGTLGSAAVLGATFLLPLFFQLARGAGEAASGSQLVPFLVSSTAGAFTAGQLARRIGRVRPIILAGMAVAAGGFVLLSFATGATPAPVLLAEIAVVGYGLGACMPSSLVVVQNAAERRDIGAATGALLLLRSLGSALGSTLVGAMLAAGFAAGIRGTELAGRVDLGALRGHGAAVPAALAPLARDALATGFHAAFLACAAVCLGALAVAAVMRDQPLRSAQG